MQEWGCIQGDTVITLTSKDIPHYYIDYYKTSYLEEEFWGIQNAIVDFNSYDQTGKD